MQLKKLDRHWISPVFLRILFFWYFCESNFHFGVVIIDNTVSMNVGENWITLQVWKNGIGVHEPHPSQKLTQQSDLLLGWWLCLDHRWHRSPRKLRYVKKFNCSSKIKFHPFFMHSRHHVCASCIANNNMTHLNLRPFGFLGFGGYFVIQLIEKQSRY